MKLRLILVFFIFNFTFPAYCTDIPLEDRFANLNISSANWTTCDSFLANTSFDASKIIDVDWKIFYFWNLEYESSYNVRFSVPTPMLIERFVVMVDSDIKPRVNWSAAEMFVETSIDLSGLLVHQDTPGLFRFIPALYMHFHSIPMLLFGIKVVDGYLGMMNCQRQVGYALASVENMPKPDQIETIAAKFKFWNPWGRSYLVKVNTTAFQVPREEDLDDVDDDEEIEIERERDMYQMF